MYKNPRKTSCHHDLVGLVCGRMNKLITHTPEALPATKQPPTPPAVPFRHDAPIWGLSLVCAVDYIFPAALGPNEPWQLVGFLCRAKVPSPGVPLPKWGRVSPVAAMKHAMYYAQTYANGPCRQRHQPPCLVGFPHYDRVTLPPPPTLILAFPRLGRSKLRMC